METTLFTPVWRYLTLGKTIQLKITHGMVKPCFRVREISYDSTKCFQSAFNGGRKISSKNMLDLSKKQFLITHGRRFSLKNKTRTQLMDLQVYKTPSLVNIIKNIINVYQIKNLDDEFNIYEFASDSKAALVVVSQLLAELNFEELNGLLTDECKAEVEKNVRGMESAQRYDLAVKMEDIFFFFPYHTKIIRGGNENERTYFQITVMYHICKNYSSLNNKNPWKAVAESNLEMFTLYNCKFIKEFTKGTDDQWTISGINIQKFHEDAIHQQYN